MITTRRLLAKYVRLVNDGELGRRDYVSDASKMMSRIETEKGCFTHYKNNTIELLQYIASEHRSSQPLSVSQPMLLSFWLRMHLSWGNSPRVCIITTRSSCTGNKTLCNMFSSRCSTPSNMCSVQLHQSAHSSHTDLPRLLVRYSVTQVTVSGSNRTRTGSLLVDSRILCIESSN